jgi:hypothetical protein
VDGIPGGVDRPYRTIVVALVTGLIVLVTSVTNHRRAINPVAPGSIDVD